MSTAIAGRQLLSRLPPNTHRSSRLSIGHPPTGSVIIEGSRPSRCNHTRRIHSAARKPDTGAHPPPGIDRGRPTDASLAGRFVLIHRSEPSLPFPPLTRRQQVQPRHRRQPTGASTAAPLSTRLSRTVALQIRRQARTSHRQQHPDPTAAAPLPTHEGRQSRSTYKHSLRKNAPLNIIPETATEMQSRFCVSLSSFCGTTRCACRLQAVSNTGLRRPFWL